MTDEEATGVVTCFLRHRGEVLLLRRSEAVGSYTGRWGAVAGHAEGDPDALAREEIAEETGLLDAATLVRAGEPFTVTDDDRDTPWRVHPYLFECERRGVETNEETTEYEWVAPAEILRRDTVPDLWESYERVAPTVETVRDDTEHGSATISVRALAVLADRAGALAAEADDGRNKDEDAWDEVAALARDLREARPGMVAVENRVNRAIHEATRNARTPAAVERTARAELDRALEADASAAANAATEIDGARVLTLSRSGTVLETLRQTDPDAVLVAESRPAREGVGVAETLVESLSADTTVTLAVDAAVAHLLAERPIVAVVIGADTVLSDGTVVNKVGTRLAALAAAHEGVPVHAVAASDKIASGDEPRFEAGDPDAVYDGDADLAVANPTFDATPPDLLRGLVTEDGVLDADEIASVAEEHRARRGWSEE